MPSEQVVQAVRPGEVVFRVHAPMELVPERVSADVFARKLGTLVEALKAADRATHDGVTAHRYAIAKLESSTPTVVIAEIPAPKFVNSLVIGPSGIDGFSDCAAAVSIGDRDRALRYGRCAKFIDRLGRGANKAFGYAEIWTKTDNIIRVDPFLQERARAVLAPPSEKETDRARTQRWFKGTAHGSFDGMVLEVDLRGALPQLKLILSAGGKEIDCIARNEDVEKIRASLKTRVRVFGNAIYDGRSGLPRRIQISDIVPMPAAGDFSRWKGAFEPFEASEWEADE